MNRSRPSRSEVLVMAGVVLVAVNLRPAAASIGPLIHRIETDTGLRSGWASVLTTLPVLCFGLLAPLAPVVAKRFGVRSSIAGAMVALLASQQYLGSYHIPCSIIAGLAFGVGVRCQA